MKRGAHEDLSKVLDKAITGLDAEVSIEEYLDAHPQFASELDPLLRTAAALQAEAATPLPPDLEDWLPIGARDFAAIAEQMLAQPTAKAQPTALRTRPAWRGRRRVGPDFAAILDQALGQVAAGTSIEDCLALYPQQAHDLEPLLHTGAVLRAHAATPLPPDLEAWLPIGARDFAAIAERIAPRSVRQRSSSLQHVTWQRAVAALVLAVALMGADTAAAASLPGQPLYTWKRAKENITLSLTSDPTALSNLHAYYADQRLGELTQLAASDEPVDPASVEDVSTSLLTHLEEVGDRDSDPAIRDLFNRSKIVLADAAREQPASRAQLLDALDQVAKLEQQPTPVALTTPTDTSAEPSAEIATSIATSDPTPTPTTASGNGSAPNPNPQQPPIGAPTDTSTPRNGPTPTLPIDDAVPSPSSEPLPAIPELPSAVPELPPEGQPLPPTIPGVPPATQVPPQGQPLPTSTPPLPTTTALPRAPTFTPVPTPTAVATQGPAQPPPTPPLPPTRPTRVVPPTPVPPTDTPVPPTDTPVPPTDTPVPPETPTTFPQVDQPVATADSAASPTP